MRDVTIAASCTKPGPCPLFFTLAIEISTGNRRVFLLHIMKACCRVNGGITPLILQLGARWMCME